MLETLQEIFELQDGELKTDNPHQSRDDERLLICDLAETYGIFDYRQLPSGGGCLILWIEGRSRLGQKKCMVSGEWKDLLLAVIADRTGDSCGTHRSGLPAVNHCGIV